MRRVKSGLKKQEIGEETDVVAVAVTVARRREEESIGVGRHGVVAPPSGKLSALQYALFDKMPMLEVRSLDCNGNGSGLHLVSIGFFYH